MRRLLNAWPPELFRIGARSHDHQGGEMKTRYSNSALTIASAISMLGLSLAATAASADSTLLLGVYPGGDVRNTVGGDIDPNMSFLKAIDQWAGKPTSIAAFFTGLQGGPDMSQLDSPTYNSYTPFIKISPTCTIGSPAACTEGHWSAAQLAQGLANVDMQTWAGAIKNWALSNPVPHPISWTPSETRW